MKITRKFTTPGQNPFDTVEWVRRSSRITNPDGSIVFQMDDAEVPKSWSQLATDIMVSKYFRKAGVPADGGPNGLPDPDWEATERRSDEATEGEEQTVPLGPEKSARQVIHRLAGCWRHWGEKHGYFDSKKDAEAFYDELVYMLLHQMAAPNSPQWFNTGLHWAYGITGPAQGHYYCDPRTGKLKEADDAYSHPQPHACFIQSVDDDLVSPGGIMDLWVREARLFKYGSGTGTNFSKLRAEDEPLSGGGKSSGLMSWLRIGDRAAAAIKSGGTTRRAAKMVCLDMDHPDIDQFINWKVREEVKVAAMVEGLKALKKSDKQIRETAERLGLNLDYDFNGEAYQTVSGQNSNNSVRIPDRFFEAVDKGAKWPTSHRTTGRPATEHDAGKLWDDLCFAAWRCADPGVQFDSTINAWHTCPSAGRINASNPCSEYMFLDNTACNLASLNAIRFYDPQTRAFDVEAFEHAVDIWTVVLEISVLMASFPSKEIAELSYKYRTLGLGYANLGAMLMQAGIPYDSDEARAVCAMVTAVLCGRSYRMSAEMASALGPFAGYEPDRENMLRVIRNHRLAATGESRESSQYKALKIRPVPIDHALVDSGRIPIKNAKLLLRHAVKAWDDAYTLGSRHGFRNAQVTVIAPTGTIGLLMDCDTTGVEPDFALVKFKKLAGGGYFKIANASVRPALSALGYAEHEVRDILTYLMGTLSLDVPMPEGSPDARKGQTFADWLTAKGFTQGDLDRITDALPGVFELGFAFSPWSLGDETLGRLGIDDPAKAKATPGFNILRRLGLSAAQIEQLNEQICGTQTVEGAPHLKDEHLPVFDCANACGRKGKRFIHTEGHIRMMAASQPFISGAISKTINLPNDASIADIAAAYRLSWELGLKANALYRDGCKLSQPLSTKSDAAVDEEVEKEVSELGESPEDIPAAPAPAAAAAPGSPPLRGGSDPGTPPPRGGPDAPTDPAPRIVKEVQIVHKPMRRRLPDTRQSITHKFNIAGHEGYLTVGLYDDGKPGELFITMSKEGSTIGGLMDSLGTAVSVALQYGVPIESLVNKFTHQRFEPAGMTMNKDIPFAKSLVDYIFRWLGIQFIPGYREANAPRRPEQTPERETEKDPWSKTPGSSGRADSPEAPVHAQETNGSGARSAVGGANGGHAQARTPASAAHAELTSVSVRASTLTVAMSEVGDAPACDVCGTITVRSGTCYKCLNCGNSMGCS
jgi:ribonucleoside-diphosphate reductase alpha chain